jgi:hypothetical protein
MLLKVAALAKASRLTAPEKAALKTLVVQQDPVRIFMHFLADWLKGGDGSDGSLRH